VIREAYEENWINPFSLGDLAPSVLPIGGNIEVTPKSLDFSQERTDSIDDHPTKEILISNSDEDILIIKDIVLQGESFTLEEPSLSVPLPVMAGEEAVISIGFSPSETDNVTGLLSIESTDHDTSMIEVLLIGEKSSARPANHESSRETSYVRYDLYPYKPLSGSFYLYEQPFALFNINQSFSYSVPDFLFTWDYFNNPPGNPFSFFSYLPVNNFFSQSFCFPSSNDYRSFNDYTSFPFYVSWE
jgi:hypothetical protein